MSSPRREAGWRVDGVGGATVCEVARRLARAEALNGLRYRDVELLPVVIDVLPCHPTAAGTGFRLLRLQPADWPPRCAGHPLALPERWESAAIPIPRGPRAGIDAGLARVETAFAIRAFLNGVAREIDVALERCARHKARPHGPVPPSGPGVEGGRPALPSVGTHLQLSSGSSSSPVGLAV